MTSHAQLAANGPRSEIGRVTVVVGEIDCAAIDVRGGVTLVRGIVSEYSGVL